MPLVVFPFWTSPGQIIKPTIHLIKKKKKNWPLGPKAVSETHLLTMSTSLEAKTCMASVWMSSQRDKPAKNSKFRKIIVTSLINLIYYLFLHPLLPVLHPCWPTAQCHQGWRWHTWPPGLSGGFYSLGASLASDLKHRQINRWIYLQLFLNYGTVVSDSVKSTKYLQHNTVQLHLGWVSVCHRTNAQLLMFPESWTFCEQTHGPDQKHHQKHKPWISTKKLKVRFSWGRLLRIRIKVALIKTH